MGLQIASFASVAILQIENDSSIHVKVLESVNVYVFS